jgi:hypothetical protein
MYVSRISAKRRLGKKMSSSCSQSTFKIFLFDRVVPYRHVNIFNIFTAVMLCIRVSVVCFVCGCEFLCCYNVFIILFIIHYVVCCLLHVGYSLEYITYVDA